MKKIANRFALLMAAAAVLPLLAYGAASIISLRAGAQEAVIVGNRNVAKRAAEQIALYLAGSVRFLKAAAAELQHTGLVRWQKDRILKNYALQFPEFTELTLLDGTGSPEATSRIGAPSVTVPGSDSVEIGGVLMSKFDVDQDLLPTAVLAVPLSSNGEGGWLVARLNLEELWRMVDEITVGERGFALVVTGDGRLLAHGDPDAKPLVAQGRDMRSHPLVAALTQAAAPDAPNDSRLYDDWSEESLTRDRGEIVGVTAPISELGWTVIVEQPTSEAFAIPLRLQRQLGVAIALALLAMLTAGYFWGRSFINPILRLTRGTRALAEGRLDERVEIDSSDELGELGAAFNNMADRLVELQEDIKKQERQAMFGRVAIGLVHDLSHPIMNLGNSCKFLMKAWNDEEYRATFSRTVERELAQVRRVLDDLRNIAKPQPLEKFPLDVNKALTELAEAMRAGADSSGLTLDTELVFGPLYIEGDLFALNRVYRNLLTNAFQATSPRGRVVVRSLRQHDHAIVEIADTGCGIPPERLGTIFDDFVTTKRRGLGLGLATSKKIVEQMGGTISVASEVGVGSTFSIQFPLTKARPSQVAAG